jgi:putative glutamine amidotransferase
VAVAVADVPRPLIGVTAGSTDVTILEGRLPAFYAGRANPRAIVRAGGDPVILGAVPEASPDAADHYAEALDGFVLAGGVDIAPSAYGATAGPEDSADHARDRFELALVRAARRRRKPILGVCRGMEILAVAFGGVIVDGVQHTVAPGPMAGFERVVRHRIALAPGSLAASVYGATELEVACLHHQRPDAIPEPLTASGWAADGVIEALEGDPADGFLLGLLWHPEYIFEADPVHLRPYQALVEAALNRRTTPSPQSASAV